MPDTLTPGTYAVTNPAIPFEYLTYRPASPRPYIFHAVTDRATVALLLAAGQVMLTENTRRKRHQPPRPKHDRHGLHVIPGGA